ncbi:hypothetical protein M440DRAFT_334854 [Trichoderma longibrachiatum ATCC 18648]|uniref:Uncharacterized protein n=1 Tax=Trichoderma longibrachiatum ATCC 18648 TaxID=983965 RepID=A0A2T4C0A9_TRILO|nr:hypothetical protein M440DRAFT_334854 [Trichoderma longibrachiatum ATCC 18648]
MGDAKGGNLGVHNYGSKVDISGLYVVLCLRYLFIHCPGLYNPLLRRITRIGVYCSRSNEWTPSIFGPAS